MSFKRVIAICVLLELLILIAAFVFDGFTLTTLQTATRFSGRLSLVIFSLLFLLQAQPRTLHAWLSDNPYLVFAIAHGIHLIELGFYVTLSGNELIPHRLLGGFVAYVLIFTMPYLEWTKRSGRVSEKFFSRFNSFYQFYVWFIFFMSYLPRVLGTLPNVGGNYWEHVILFIWVILILVLRLIRIAKVRFAGNMEAR